MCGVSAKTHFAALITCICFSTAEIFSNIPSAISPFPPYCAATKRYDVGAFPPRCFDCPRVMSNPMQVARVATTLQVQRSVKKFSPGMPQNQTCGCWQSSNQTFDIALNASWIVSGLAFSNERARWLKEFDVQASNDNRTFIPWGVFNMTNFTSASLVLFSYPIRAKFFRVTVQRYNNHYVNFSTGFPLKPVQALVSRDQPFTCGCPMLSSGACCPFINMTVRNDTCVWCMDPSDIMTKMVDGCGKCKQGAFEHAGRCYKQVKQTHEPTNSLSVGNPFSDGVNWTIEVNFTTDARSMVALFVARNGGVNEHPCIKGNTGFSSSLISTCCLRNFSNSSNNVSTAGSAMYTPILWNFTPPDENNNTANPSSSILDENCSAEASTNPPSSIKQFVQFDRGRKPFRYILSFTEQEIRSLTSCVDTMCTGTIGALFMTTVTVSSTMLPQLVQQPIQYNLNVPPLVCSTRRNLPMQARVEMHYYATTNTHTVRILGAELSGDLVRYQWVSGNVISEWTQVSNSLELIIAHLPLNDPTFNASSLRIMDATTTTLRIDPPFTPVIHDSLTQSTHAGISVNIQYGFGFSAMPSFGDTDQIVIVTARSTQPARLRRLVTVTNPGGQSVAYTTPRGFISDTRRVVDLGIACYQGNSLLSKWLLQALQLLDTEGLSHARFIERSCRMVISGEAAKAYWLVPYRGATSINDRTALAGVDVIAEFA